MNTRTSLVRTSAVVVCCHEGAAKRSRPRSRRTLSHCLSSYSVRFLTPIFRLSRPLSDPARRAAIAVLPVTSSYLQMDFPQVRGLSELRRDPHLLGWFRCLGEQDPSHRRSSSSRRISLCGRSSNNSSAPLMTGTPNCPTSYLVRFLTCVSRLSGPLYDPARRAAIAALPVTSSPISKWISPQLLHLSGLRRDPHLLGWFRRL